MHCSLVTGDAAKLRSEVLLVAVFESDIKEAHERAKALASLDSAHGGGLLRAARVEDFGGKPNQTFSFQAEGRPSRVVLLGLGKREKFEPEALRLAAGRGTRAAQRLAAKSVALVLPEVREVEACVKAAVEGVLLGAWRFDRYKSEKNGERAKALQKAELVLPPGIRSSAALTDALRFGTLVAQATNWTRVLVNEPANALGPSNLAGFARKAARESGLRIQVLSRDRIAALRMGMFLGVAQGSAEPPVLVHLWWKPRGRPTAPPLALVGKAVTFDSGGLSLKTTESMMEMKTDMAGSAAVLGAMKVVGALKPGFEVHAFFGACENMPGGRAYKIGDVLTSRSGKTVEITNTDAEGRLVLGDVLTWASEHKPAGIVDVATLTGACVVALGLHTTGVFGSDDALTWEVLEAARAAGEDMWRMPLTELQKDSLKSEIADMKNTGDRWGGAINAALFLREFVGSTPWVHLDIAGPATSPKERGYLLKGATGVGVRTLCELVRARMRQAERG